MVAALGAAGLAATGAQAVTMNDTFDVDINLTAACNLSAVSNVAFSYVSNQGAAQGSTGGDFTVTCTPGVVYSFSFEHPVGTPTASPVTETDNVVNLQYTLTLPAAVAATGVGQNYSIAGNMPAGQPGNCGAAACTNAAATNKTFNLVVTY